MRELKVGDVVDMFDGSYSFGISNGAYSPRCDDYEERKGLKVIEVGLDAMQKADGGRSGDYNEVCDILVTGNKGSFWFAQSRFVRLSMHTIAIDGKEIKISDESFENLKKQLTI